MTNSLSSLCFPDICSVKVRSGSWMRMKRAWKAKRWRRLWREEDTASARRAFPRCHTPCSARPYSTFPWWSCTASGRWESPAWNAGSSSTTCCGASRTNSSRRAPCGRCSCHRRRHRTTPWTKAFERRRRPLAFWQQHRYPSLLRSWCQ